MDFLLGLLTSRTLLDVTSGHSPAAVGADTISMWEFSAIASSESLVSKSFPAGQVSESRGGEAAFHLGDLQNPVLSMVVYVGSLGAHKETKWMMSIILGVELLWRGGREGEIPGLHEDITLSHFYNVEGGVSPTRAHEQGRKGQTLPEA